MLCVNMKAHSKPSVNGCCHHSSYAPLVDRVVLLSPSNPHLHLLMAQVPHLLWTFQNIPEAQGRQHGCVWWDVKEHHIYGPGTTKLDRWEQGSGAEKSAYGRFLKKVHRPCDMAMRTQEDPERSFCWMMAAIWGNTLRKHLLHLLTDGSFVKQNVWVPTD